MIAAPTTAQAVMRVARREFTERLRERSFVVSTIVSALVLVVIAALPSLLDRPTRWTVGVTDARSAELAAGVRALLLAGEPDARVTIRTYDGEAAGRQAVEAGDVSALIIAPDPDAEPEVVVERRLSDERAALLAVAIQRLRLVEQADELGISRDAALRLAEPGRFRVDALRPLDDQRETDVNLARVAGILMFIQVMAFGSALASGVVEEKSSRVVEVLLARIRPTTLLTGKLLGIGALGLAQTAVYVVVGLVAIAVAGTATISGTSVGIAAAVLAWFVLGFAFYSTLFLVAGALAGRAEDLQSTMSLAMIVSMASYVGTIFAGDPESTPARIVSLVPSAAPMAMPQRLAAGDASLIEVALAIVLLLGAIALLIRLAARVYQRTILSRTQQGLLRVLRRSSE